MAFDLRADGVLAFFAGTAIAALGLAVARLRPRSHASVAFAAFAALFGVVNMTGALSWLAADGTTAFFWGVVTMAGYIPLYAFALEFAATISWSRDRLRRTLPLRAVLAVPAAIGLLTLATRPSLFVVPSASYTDASHWLGYGAGAGVVFTLNYAAYGVALALVMRKMLSLGDGPQRSQLAFVGVALLILVSTTLGVDIRNASRLANDPTSALTLLRVASILVRTTVLAWVVLRVWRDVAAPLRGWALVAAFVPALASMLERALAADGGSISTAGLWRLIVVSILAYAIGRHRMFDLELRLKALVPAMAYLALGLATLGLAWRAFGESFGRWPWLGIAVALGVAVAAAPVPRWSRALAQRAFPGLGEPDYLYQRKIQLYRAALEEAQSDGAGHATQERFLTELRRGLAISETEHRALLAIVRGDRSTSAAAPLERFKNIRELGRGASGQAILAHDLKLDRRVVLKQLAIAGPASEERRKQLLHEARLASRVKHPNVVTVHDVIDEGPTPTLVLEYVEGGNLADVLAARTRLSTPELVRLASAMLAGLSEIHRAGIVHRDLKPANVLLAADGTPKIADFGVAHQALPREGELARTRVSSPHPGSIAFMSPEQTRGEPLDGRSDLYALGVILYQCATGRFYLELEGFDEASAIRAIAFTRPDLALVPAALRPTLAKALAKRAAERWPDAHAMRASLPA